MALQMAQSRTELKLIGTPGATRALENDIDLAAKSDARVLITGETGVGKDLIARLIHQRSSRRLAPLATVNCAGLTDTLIESELFGHTRGSFTDAYRDKPGILESAPNGTVFLDEVGEMSPRMQASLLRFLETGEIQRVGATSAMTCANVRIIAATNRDLHAAVADGTFRQDLFYRLDVIHIVVPPLRERREDIPPLLEHFLAYYVRHHRTSAREWSPDAIDLLSAYDWPGNVRQLRNAVERMVLRSAGARVEIEDVPVDLQVNGMTTTASAAKATAAHGGTEARDLLRRMLRCRRVVLVDGVRAVHEPRPASRRTEDDSQRRARTDGSYRLVVRLFNMPDADYKRFLSFLSNLRMPSPVPHVPCRRRIPRSIRVVA